jgi:hypothetical protein
MSQSCAAITEQGAHSPLAEKLLDFAPFLLRFHKGMYLVEGAE